MIAQGLPTGRVLLRPTAEKFRRRQDRDELPLAAIALDTGERGKPAGGLVSLSPDGRTLAARHEGGPVHLLEVGPRALPLPYVAENMGEPEERAVTFRRVVRATLDGHGARALAWSPNGRLFALGRDDGSVSLWNTYTATELHRFQAHVNHVNGVGFVANGRWLATAGDDAAILLWDVTAMLKGKVPAGTTIEKRDLPGLWAELGHAESARSFKAQVRLIQVPDTGVPFIREQLCAPPPAAVKRLKQLVQDLDSASFETRQNATKTLEELGEHAETALQQALAARPSLEVTRRIEELLRRRAAARESELPRFLRAIEILEHVGSKEAQETLRTLSRGSPAYPRVQAAQAALRRLSGS
jgi:hypothetical protein